MGKTGKSKNDAKARYDAKREEQCHDLKEHQNLTFKGARTSDLHPDRTQSDNAGDALPIPKDPKATTPKDNKKSSKPFYHGHRERLRRRLIEKGADSLADYEILEFLLFGANPRGDTKPLAKTLINQFGSLAGVFAASDREIMAVEGVGNSALGILRCVPAAASRMIEREVLTNPVISSWEKLIDYCRMGMGRKKVEVFRILFLDRKNRIIADEIQQQGTVDHTPVYVREVIKRSLNLSATAIILVHNHPSGDAMPSDADIAVTKEIKKACDNVGIALHDHLIITKNDQFSFKSFGLV